jgi:hypothetical protein
LDVRKFLIDRERSISTVACSWFCAEAGTLFFAQDPYVTSSWGEFVAMWGSEEKIGISID